MAYDPNYRPKKRVYDEVPTSEPVKDDMLIVSRKVYNDDGTVSANTWFYDRDTLNQWSDEGGVLTLDVKNKNSRRRITSYPINELFWYAYEPPTQAYFDACDRWARANFGVSYEMYKQASHNAFVIEQETKIKQALRERWVKHHPGEEPPSLDQMNLDIINLDMDDNHE